MTAPLDLELGQVVGGRYAIVRAIGAGGMGAVYEVLDQTTRRRRALKVMLPSVVAHRELRKRFEREAVVAAEIQSDHIAEVFDAGVDEELGVPFIVLELLQGEDLGGRVAARGPLPLAEVALHLSQAALALDKAHAAGIVHRDLKPENLFITTADDGSSRLKLLDFGIAKVVAASQTGPQTRGILGTPLFMAPEQVHDEVAVGPASDVYALGHIAYALLAGEPYWTKEEAATDSVYGLLMKLVAGPSEPASARARARKGVALPRGFDAWFDRATAAAPKDRFASAGELAASLQHLADATAAGGAVGPTQPGADPTPPPGPAGAAHAAPTVLQLPSPSLGGDSLAGRAVTAHAPARPARARRGAIAVGAAGLVALGVVIVFATRATDDEGAAATPSAEVRADAAPTPPPSSSTPPSPAPSAAGATRAAVAEPTPSLAGRWRSDSGRLYDVVWTDGAYAFHIVDPASFTDQGYVAGEVRFRLTPREGGGYAVEDRLRPPPPWGMRYGEASRATCIVPYVEHAGAPLTASLSGGALRVQMVHLTPLPTSFASQGGIVSRCDRLERGRTAPVTSTLTRP